MSGFNKDENGPTAFFRRIKKGVEDTVAKPLPGIVRLTKFTEKEPASKPASKQASSADRSHSANGAPKTSQYKITQFVQILQQENVDLKALRKLGWNGVPFEFRAEVWQMLLGYMPRKARKCCGKKTKGIFGINSNVFQVIRSR